MRSANIIHAFDCIYWRKDAWMGENVEALEWSYVSSREKFFKVNWSILDKLDEYPKFFVQTTIYTVLKNKQVLVWSNLVSDYVSIF